MILNMDPKTFKFGISKKKKTFLLKLVDVSISGDTWGLAVTASSYKIRLFLRNIKRVFKCSFKNTFYMLSQLL